LPPAAHGEPPRGLPPRARNRVITSAVKTSRIASAARIAMAIESSMVIRRSRIFSIASRNIGYPPTTAQLTPARTRGRLGCTPKKTKICPLRSPQSRFERSRANPNHARASRRHPQSRSPYLPLPGERQDSCIPDVTPPPASSSLMPAFISSSGISTPVAPRAKARWIQQLFQIRPHDIDQFFGGGSLRGILGAVWVQDMEPDMSLDQFAHQAIQRSSASRHQLKHLGALLLFPPVRARRLPLAREFDEPGPRVFSLSLAVCAMQPRVLYYHPV